MKSAFKLEVVEVEMDLKPTASDGDKLTIPDDALLQNSGFYRPPFCAEVYLYGNIGRRSIGYIRQHHFVRRTQDNRDSSRSAEFASFRSYSIANALTFSRD